MVLLFLLLDCDLSVEGRRGQGPLHEEAREDVQGAEEVEGRVEDEEARRRLADPRRQVVVQAPVVAAAGRHVQAQHGSLHAAEGVQELVVQARVPQAGLVEVLLHVVLDQLDEEEGEYHRDEAQHHAAPEEGEEGVDQRDDHHPKVVEDLDHVHQAEDAGDPQRAERAEEGQLDHGLAQKGGDHAPDREHDDDEVHDVPARVLDDEEPPPVQRQPQGELDGEVDGVDHLQVEELGGHLLPEVRHGVVLDDQDDEAVAQDHEHGHRLERRAPHKLGQAPLPRRLLQLVPPVEKSDGPPLQQHPQTHGLVLAPLAGLPPAERGGRGHRQVELLHPSAAAHARRQRAGRRVVVLTRERLVLAVLRRPLLAALAAEVRVF
mmetsp:Transcript_13194/g.39340  ORF Transcript_13194/g.39340 Transcript_13194/m.39340 type:complete len:376 (+) Transcript_13194:832-1959(+)